MFMVMCGGKLGKNPHPHFFGLCGYESKTNNLVKVIMKALLISGGLPWNQIAQKFVCFGVDGINVSLGTKIAVTKQIHDKYASNYLKIFYVAHHTNLIMQTLSSLDLVIILKIYYKPCVTIRTFI